MKTLLQPAVWCGLLLFLLFGTLGCTEQTPATVSAETSELDNLPESITVDVQEPDSLNAAESGIVDSDPVAPDAAGLDGEDPSLSFDDEPAAELLAVGSKAPALDIENWVSDGHGKFKPVTTFEDGKAYVVEFWATWCGPCVQSMPHSGGAAGEVRGQGSTDHQR